MNYEVVATEKIIKFSLDGINTAFKIGGDFSEKALSHLVSALKSNSTEGKKRLKTMLKSGRELSVFNLNRDQLKPFSLEAKKYGISYCIISDKAQAASTVELLIHSTDKERFSRIINNLSDIRKETQAEANDENDITYIDEKSKSSKEMSPAEFADLVRLNSDKVAKNLPDNARSVPVLSVHSSKKEIPHVEISKGNRRSVVKLLEEINRKQFERESANKASLAFSEDIISRISGNTGNHIQNNRKEIQW